MNIVREGAGFRTFCPKCAWTQRFEKVQNAFTRLAEHLQVKHRIRAVFGEGTVEAIQKEMRGTK